jgi:dTDP-4-amino-4,6-dideoxy-D-galactose acyltransferase
MRTSYEILEWDTRFFGYKVASIHASKLDPDDLKRILPELAENEIKLAYCFVNPDDIVSSKTIINASGILVDEKVTYFINGFREHRLVDSNIRSYSLTYPTEKLKILALQSGLYSRFKVDPNFKNNEFEKLYEQWIVNSVKKITANECLVYFDGEVEKGFITLAIKEDTGSIGLIAVDEMERGKSIGRKLLNASFDYFSKRNIDRVEVVTQKANESACVFYEKLGFEVKNIINIYHLWLI